MRVPPCHGEANRPEQRWQWLYQEVAFPASDPYAKEVDSSATHCHRIETMGVLASLPARHHAGLSCFPTTPTPPTS